MLAEFEFERSCPQSALSTYSIRGILLKSLGKKQIWVHFQLLFLESGWNKHTKESSGWNFTGLDLQKNRNDVWFRLGCEIRQFSVPVFWESILSKEKAVN